MRVVGKPEGARTISEGEYPAEVVSARLSQSRYCDITIP